MVLEGLEIAFRWSRTFSEPATFADDLGELGVFVGPRRGALRRTQDQKEDYVLRRVLVAQNRAGLLRCPFKVHAFDQKLEAPDFLIQGEGGRRGLEVTEASTQGHISHQIRKAIERKAQKFNKGAHQDHPCDLVVYINTEDVLDEGVIDDVRDAHLAGRFGRIHVLAGDRVYLDVLKSEPPHVVNLRHDYSIDFCGWIDGQVESLRDRDLARLDIENLIEELNALAKRDEKALKNRLKNLLALLLKWHHQPSGRSSSWRGTIHDNCTRIDDLLEGSPSLRSRLDPQGEVVAKAYDRARTKAAIETGLAVAEFPEACPWPTEFSDAARGGRSLEAAFRGLVLEE